MGAGTGWLSCRLAQAGYRVLALEASLDKVFGLGATDMYLATRTHFLPVQGNLEHPPLQEGTLSLAIFNASLHYAADLIGTLRRSAESLQPDGRLIVLDTPVARHPVPGTGRGNRHLGRQELHGALLSVGLRPRWVPVRRAVRWWVYQMKMRLKGDAPFSFPMVVADRNPK
jgi:SAM-dependent methyltransferase